MRTCFSCGNSLSWSMACQSFIFSLLRTRIFRFLNREQLVAESPKQFVLKFLRLFSLSTRCSRLGND
ncbi:hypothetical protein BpHYR1_001280 [Brachionus plicatilis]|uniref:Uncharacterized protein n=1 Tax=Brachionus plicatilis TaxID=10195 RepID=A0A3M7P7F3_BRAPC|nr:hypothetical protein BpHYR1_001280 [Brachionus plicatilis]